MTIPWRHQVEALEFVKAKPGSMLAMDMGTGKSRVAIDLIKEHGYRRTLILCPLSIVSGVWPGQFETHDGTVSVLPLDNFPARPYRSQSAADRKAYVVTKALEQDEPLAVVVNYESAYRGFLGKTLMDTPWDLLVMDESHRIKSPGGVVSRFCSRLSDRIPQRLALTGTPMPHSPMDIYAQFRALDKSVYGTSNTKFKSRYAILGGFSNHQVVAFQNLDELQAKFQSLSYRVTIDEVMDLPETLDIYNYCELSPKARQVYHNLEEDFIADLEEGRITAANALARLLRLQQITSGFARSEDGSDIGLDTGKTRLLRDILEGIGSEPVVVFCRFRYDLAAIADIARELSLPVWEISGRTKELDQWQANGGVLAVQIQAGGLGLDLTQARYAMYYSLGFSLGDYLQSRARLHRPGQKDSVRYIHLMARDSVDEKVISALHKRQDVINSILEGGLR